MKFIKNRLEIIETKKIEYDEVLDYLSYLKNVFNSKEKKLKLKEL